MTSLQTNFNRSKSLEQYIEQMKDNKENLLSIYKSFSPPADDERIKQLQQTNYSKVLVITEDLSLIHI